MLHNPTKTNIIRRREQRLYTSDIRRREYVYLRLSRNLEAAHAVVDDRGDDGNIELLIRKLLASEHVVEELLTGARKKKCYRNRSGPGTDHDVVLVF